ncbi:hypothetical protein BN946_scf184354.g22 [Trametes cinnabarina]|uniref:Uncharacterized protein n=1 Tax=Pycnoporus cinnabarinus TaxID=5643 RepID=A0A060S6M7_PYCCI|nr:hypothetical protein BN946_scf184354.g22 [Trametes cinnabarina]
MNDNPEPIHAFLGPAAHGFAPTLYDRVEKMIMLHRTPLNEPPSLCTQWWLEDLVATQMRAEEPVCGEDPEVVENYIAWLSEDQMAELERLEARTCTAQEAGSRAATATDYGRIEAQTCRGSTSQDKDDSSREESEVWMDQAERSIELWADVLRVAMDHANGLTQEERGRLSEPYADWAGPPPPGFDCTIW